MPPAEERLQSLAGHRLGRKHHAPAAQTPPPCVGEVVERRVDGSGIDGRDVHAPGAEFAVERAGEAVQKTLRRGVGRNRGVGHPGRGRRHEQDRTAAAPHQLGGVEAAQQQGSRAVERHDRAQTLGRRRLGQPEEQHPGVADQNGNVQSAARGLVVEPLRGVLPGKVQTKGQRRDSVLPGDLPGGRAVLLLTVAHQHHAVAPCGQLRGTGPADARRGARYEGIFSFFCSALHDCAVFFLFNPACSDPAAAKFAGQRPTY